MHSLEGLQECACSAVFISASCFFAFLGYCCWKVQLHLLLIACNVLVLMPALFCPCMIVLFCNGSDACALQTITAACVTLCVCIFELL